MSDFILATLVFISGSLVGYAYGVYEGQANVYYERVVCSPDLAKRLVCISNPDKKEN